MHTPGLKRPGRSYTWQIEPSNCACHVKWGLPDCASPVSMVIRIPVTRTYYCTHPNHDSLESNHLGWLIVKKIEHPRVVSRTLSCGVTCVGASELWPIADVVPQNWSRKTHPKFVLVSSTEWKQLKFGLGTCHVWAVYCLSWSLTTVLPFATTSLWLRIWAASRAGTEDANKIGFWFPNSQSSKSEKKSKQRLNPIGQYWIQQLWRTWRNQDEIRFGNDIYV